MKVYIKTGRLEIMPFRVKDFPNLAEILTNSQIKKTYMIPDFEITILPSEKAVDFFRDYSYNNCA